MTEKGRGGGEERVRGEEEEMRILFLPSNPHSIFKPIFVIQTIPLFLITYLLHFLTDPEYLNRVDGNQSLHALRFHK
jgi:hypothetical protein